MTLTLAEDFKTLQERLDRLQASFSRLRQSRDFREKVSAYAAFIEFHPRGEADTPCDPRSRPDAGWNVHYHVLTQGKYWPHSELRARWHACTGDSSIVDIQLCRDANAAAKYVGKYAAKPIQLSKYRRVASLALAIRGLAGRKLVTCGGAWRRVRLTESADDAAWECVGTIESVFQAIARGDDVATGLRELLGRGHARDAADWLNTHPPPEPLQPRVPTPDKQAKFDYGTPF